MWTLFTAAALALPLAAPLDESPSSLAADQGELEVRTYPIQDLLGPTGWADDAMAMLPYRWASNYHADFELGGDETRTLHPEDVVSLVRECVAREYWDSDAGSLDVSSSSQMIVVCSASVHREIERFLKFLGATVSSKQRLQVQVFRGRLGERETLLLSEQASDARIAAMTQSGKLKAGRQVSAALPSGLLQRAESVDVESVPYDWEVEIAQGATVAHATHSPVTTGLSMISRGAQTPSGTLIDLLLRYAEEVGRDSVNLGSYATINTKTGMASTQHTGRVEHPRVAFVSLATTVLLQPGQCLWMPFQLDLVSGPVEAVIVLKLEGPALPARNSHTFPTLDWNSDEGAEEDFQLAFHDLSALCTAGTHPPSIANVLFDLEVHGDAWSSENMVASFGRGELRPVMERDSLLDLLRMNCQPEAWDEDPRNTLSVMGNWLVSTSREDLSDELRVLMAALPATSMQIAHGALTMGGERVGRIALPVCSHRAAAVWAGVQNTALAQWDCDVANESSCANPEFLAAVDGLALNLRTANTMDAGQMLSVNGKLHLLTDAIQRVSYEIADNRQYSRVRTRGLALDDRRHLPAQGSLHWGGPDLGLEVELR